MSSPIAEVTVIYLMETDKGVKIAEVEDGKEIWLPQSQIEVTFIRNPSGPGVKTTVHKGKRRDVCQISAPVWLLQKEGLL